MHCSASGPNTFLPFASTPRSQRYPSSSSEGKPRNGLSTWNSSPEKERAPDVLDQSPAFGLTGLDPVNPGPGRKRQRVRRPAGPLFAHRPFGAAFEDFDATGTLAGHSF